MNSPHLLSLPDPGDTYYFRRYIPTDLIEHFGGVKQFRISLKCAIKSRSIRTCTTYHTKILRMLRQDSFIDALIQIYQLSQILRIFWRTWFYKVLIIYSNGK